jgi:hypothetical protein
MWILFIVLTSVLLIGIGLYVDSENNKFNIYKSEIKDKIKQNEFKKVKLEKEIVYYKDVQHKYQNAYNSNKALKNAIKNLLSFIPDQIVINKMVLDKYEVKIYGYIDSPKTYKLLLEPPLKSIFDHTKVGFTKIEDGKYLFSSYNKIKRVKNEKK